MSRNKMLDNKKNSRVFVMIAFPEWFGPLTGEN